MRWVVLCAALAAGVAADQPDPLLLSRFLEKVKQDLVQLPNYTCLETIQRSERSPRTTFTKTGKKQSTDAITMCDVFVSGLNHAFVIGANAMIGTAFAATAYGMSA